MTSFAVLRAQPQAVQDKASVTLPLTPTREIGFGVTEGTWMSVSVSPDGETILFDLLGDLYTVPIGGGEATAITSGMAVDRQPRFSPDGQHILFLSDRSGTINVWLAKRDGSEPRAVTSKTKPGWHPFSSPNWSADGQSILVSRPDEVDKRPGLHEKLVILGLSGRELSMPSFASGSVDPFAAVGASMSPDRRWLYASVATEPLNSILSYGKFQLARLNLSTGKSTILTHETGSALEPLVSPDGRYLVYATDIVDAWGVRGALKLMDVASGATRWLVRDGQLSAQNRLFQLGRVPHSSFTPDSRALITSYGGKLWRVEIPSGKATEIPFRAQVHLQLAPLLRFPYKLSDQEFRVRAVRDVRLSPDKKRVAFTALDHVWVMNVRGGKPRRVTDWNNVVEQSPVWSRDGRELAFGTWTDRGGHIYRVRPSAPGARRRAPLRLTREAAFYNRLTYTPDGGRLVFMRRDWRPKLEQRSMIEHHLDHHSVLATLPAQGGDITPLIELDAGEHGWPHFSRRDPRRVFYFDGSALQSIALDGSARDPRTVVKLVAPNYPANYLELRLSPAGDEGLLTSISQLWRVKIPPTPAAGKEPPTINMYEPWPKARDGIELLTPVGGDFPWWSADGNSFTYSLGASWFVHDLRAARAQPGYRAQRHDVELILPRDRPRGTLLLRGARLVTMKGSEVIESGDVLIRNNRIAALGASGTLTVPKDAHVVEVRGKTIIPGFIDLHSHVIDAPLRHDVQAWEYLLNLTYGVTSLEELQSHSSMDHLIQADRMDAGEMTGPRLFTTGTALSTSTYLPDQQSADNLVRRYGEFYRTDRIKERGVGNRLIRQWVAMAAKSMRLTPTGHWDYELVTNIVDGYSGLEHVPAVAPVYDDMVQLMARSGSVYTPTLIVMASSGGQSYLSLALRYPWEREERTQRFTPAAVFNARALRPTFLGSYPRHESQYGGAHDAAVAARIIAAGGKVGLGTDGDAARFQGLAVHWELWLLASGGMPPLDALRCGTLTAAEALGLEQDLGSVEVGKLADLQILDGNPLRDIHESNTLRYVMKNGRLYEAETLNEIWPRARPLPRQWWQEQ